LDFVFAVTGSGKAHNSMRSRKEYMPNLREVLVVSSDDEVRRNLAGIVGLCGLEPVLCVTVADSRAVLTRYPICVVVCEDQLADGNYRDLVEAVKRTTLDAPVIVVSHLADWNEYLNAVRAGAFDYIGLPPRRAEIEWVVKNALNERARQNQLEAGEGGQPSNRIGGMPWTPEE
jgi:DNA-binding NtrC family response regulator